MLKTNSKAAKRNIMNYIREATAAQLTYLLYRVITDAKIVR